MDEVAEKGINLEQLDVACEKLLQEIDNNNGDYQSIINVATELATRAENIK